MQCKCSAVRSFSSRGELICSAHDCNYHSLKSICRVLKGYHMMLYERLSSHSLLPSGSLISTSRRRSFIDEVLC